MLTAMLAGVKKCVQKNCVYSKAHMDISQLCFVKIKLCLHQQQSQM